MKDYGLKFYDLEGTQKIIYGTYQLDDFTITDLYYISKNDRYNSPKIEFTFTDQELVQSKQDVFIKSVFDINNKIVELSVPHMSTIEMMIDDLVPLSYYNTLNHRTLLAEEKRKKEEARKREEEALKVRAEKVRYSLPSSVSPEIATEAQVIEAEAKQKEFEKARAERSAIRKAWNWACWNCAMVFVFFLDLFGID